MRAYAQKASLLWLAVVASLFLGAAPSYIFANEKTSDGSVTNTEKAGTTKTPASKIDALAPLTERERWLLDRVEQLEKRVAELESKSNPKVAAPSEKAAEPTIAAQPHPAAVLSAVATAARASNDTLVATPGAAIETAINAATGNPPGTLSTKQDQTPTGKPVKAEPFAFADFTWLNGNARTKEVPMDTKFFTPEVRADISYIYDFNHPKDDTIGGSSEVFRSKEVQVTQLGVGGDFHYDNVRARPMGPRHSLSIRFRGVRWLPLRRAARDQRGCRNLHVLHWALQLL